MPGQRKSHKRKHQASASSGSGRISSNDDSTTSPYFSATNAKVSKASKKNAARLPASFFDEPCVVLAKRLLGQRLVRALGSGERLSGTVVETEAYLGRDDSACHSYRGRRSDRVEAMYMSPGTCYVYLIYGMYDCLNISSKGDGQAVLVRALEPKEGVPTMRRFRDKRRKNPAKELKTKDLCNGPGKLTAALQITKAEINQVSLTTSPEIWMEQGEGPIEEGDIVACPRIGVDYATTEWVKKPLRFYVRGGECISKRDKEERKDGRGGHLIEENYQVST